MPAKTKSNINETTAQSLGGAVLSNEKIENPDNGSDGASRNDTNDSKDTKKGEGSKNNRSSKDDKKLQNKFWVFFSRISNRKLFPLLFAFFILAALVVTFFAYFSNHALPNSKLGNQDISFWSRTKIEDYTSSRAASYSVSIRDTDEVSAIDLDKIGVSINPAETTSSIFSTQNNSLFSMLKLTSDKQYDFSNNINESKLDDFLKSQKAAFKLDSQNATITIKNGEVIILPEVVKEEAGFSSPRLKIQKSLLWAEPLTLEVKKKVIEPEITASKLRPLKNHIQDIINTKLSLKLDGITISTTKEQKGSWLTIEADSADTAAVYVDPVKVEGYLDGVIRPYIKPARPRVVVNNSDGGTTVLVHGADGVSVKGKANVVSEISNKLSSKQDSVVDVPIAYANRKTITAKDYPKWIQIDLTNRAMHVYEHEKLIRSFQVSAGAPTTPTVVGQYNIYTKVRTQTMRGLNTDGSSYIVPNVEYINYFYEGYAIHGNYWAQPTDFGHVNTSHGCVGITNGEAKWLYDWASVGTPIISHY